MAPVVPDENKIKSFRTEAAFEKWLAANHARETEINKCSLLRHPSSSLPGLTTQASAGAAFLRGNPHSFTSSSSAFAEMSRRIGSMGDS